MDIPILLTNACYLTHNDFAGVNPLAGLGGPNINRRISAPQTMREQAQFFCLNFACRFMAAVRRTPQGVPAPVDRSANLCTAVSNACLAASGDGSDISTGTITMHLPVLRLSCALNPSKIHRAKAHRAMALAALKSDSSLQTRIDRYNHHMSKARQIENTEGAA